MTLLDAVTLATFAIRDRRLLRDILLTLNGRPLDDDRRLPPRDAGEDVIAWACRCRQPLATTEDWQQAAAAARARAAHDLRNGEDRGIVPLALGSDRYPPLLSAIPDPPPVLWTMGDVAHLAKPAIAIVGSRAATPHGLEMARRLARDLASAGFVITSGLARGIDSIAHSAALDAGGTTVAVLGCGVDRIYPAEHAGLARSIRSAGAVVSEFPALCPPLPRHFPLRNRIISGLSHAVVVVEAAEQSGALITATAAVEQGREVFVVPGPVASGRNRGGHLLIRDGAKLVETADDILEDIGRPVVRSSVVGPGFSPADQLPDSVDFTVDELAERSGERPSVVLARLLELELSGQIQRIGGGRFVQTRPAEAPAKSDVLP
jgi:DNA processing protein